MFLGSILPQWVIDSGVILGMVAFLVAIVTLPTVFQMFYGGPKVELEVGIDDDVPDCRFLIGKLVNKPLDKGLLRDLCRVRREAAEEVLCKFTIVRISGGVEVIREHWVSNIKYGVGQNVQKLRLPASAYAATFSVVQSIVCDDKVVRCYAPVDENSDDGPCELTAGLYSAAITIYTDGRAKTEWHKFVVGDGLRALEWF